MLPQWFTECASAIRAFDEPELAIVFAHDFDGHFMHETAVTAAVGEITSEGAITGPAPKGNPCRLAFAVRLASVFGLCAFRRWRPRDTLHMTFPFLSLGV